MTEDRSYWKLVNHSILSTFPRNSHNHLPLDDYYIKESSVTSVNWEGERVWVAASVGGVTGETEGVCRGG